MFFKKYKKIILVIALLIVVPIFYSTFFKGPDAQTEGNGLLVSTNTTASDRQAKAVGNEIVSALNQIQTLNLSRDIFEDPVFRSLVDRSQDIPSEPVGKNNPFSPIGSTGVTPSPRATSTPSANTIINTTINRPTSTQPVI